MNPPIRSTWVPRHKSPIPRALARYHDVMRSHVAQGKITISNGVPTKVEPEGWRKMYHSNKIVPLPTETRLRVSKRDGYKCQCCGGAGESLHHILPRAEGGKNEDDNLILLCEDCHNEIEPQWKVYCTPELVRGYVPQKKRVASKKRDDEESDRDKRRAKDGITAFVAESGGKSDVWLPPVVNNSTGRIDSAERMFQRDKHIYAQRAKDRYEEFVQRIRKLAESGGGVQSQ